MDRTELENRIRTSLEARAQDVAPTPHLWEKVTDRRARHTRWMVGLWALAGSAAVAVVAIAAVQVVRAPDGPPVIDNPPVTEEPTPTQEPTPTEEPTGTDPAPGVVTGPVSVVTTDGNALDEVEPSTGEVVNELPVFDGLAEGGPIGSVAVRPGAGPELTVATMIGIEGTSWELDVTTFGPDRAHQERHRATPLDEDGQPDIRGAGGPYTNDTDAFPPTVVWSPDGEHLAWVRANPDGTNDVLTITWDALVAGEEPWVIASGLTADIGHLRAQDLTSAGTLWMTASGGGDLILEVPGECFDDPGCPDLEPRSLFMEGGSIIDVAHDANGTTMALVGRGSQSQDAEGSTVVLLAAPMSDNQHVLELPEGSVLEGAAVPPDGWLVAAGDWAVLGYGSSAQLLTLTGEFEEDLEVTGSIDLPEGTRAAGLALTSTEQATAEPSPEATEATVTTAAVGQDGVPAHVVVHDPGVDEFRLVHRAQPDQSLATWGRPDGVDGETSLAEVVVHPSSTPDDLQLVTRWVIGESDVFARTILRDGQVLANTVFDAEGQPRNIGGATEIADSSPVFSPSGDWLAWAETPEGAQGPARIRIVSWSDGGPTGPTTYLEAPRGEARPMGLLDWASQPPGTDILTMRSVSGPAGQSDPGFVDLAMEGFDGSTPADDDLDWRWVPLPGALFDAGSFLQEDGSQRYVAFSDGEGVVRYGLAEAPETAVETSVRSFGEGRLLAFGPDSAVTQRPDGGWERVQVDTGAASAVSIPDGTVALLPWATVIGG